MSNQNNRENVNLDSALKEIIKSNKLILELINKPLLSEQKKNLLNSPIFIEKISLIFNFYLRKEKAPVPQSANVNTNANSNSNEREDNIDLKDLEELKKKIKNDNFVQLTPCMEYILLYFADNLVKNINLLKLN